MRQAVRQLSVHVHVGDGVNSCSKCSVARQVGRGGATLRGPRVVQTGQDRLLLSLAVGWLQAQCQKGRSCTCEALPSAHSLAILQVTPPHGPQLALPTSAEGQSVLTLLAFTTSRHILACVSSSVCSRTRAANSRRAAGQGGGGGKPRQRWVEAMHRMKMMWPWREGRCLGGCNTRAGRQGHPQSPIGATLARATHRGHPKGHLQSPRGHRQPPPRPPSVPKGHHCPPGPPHSAPSWGLQGPPTVLSFMMFVSLLLLFLHVE